MEKKHEKNLLRVMELGAINKVEFVEAFILKTKSMTIEVSEGKVESMTKADVSGMGIRVIHDQKVGYGYTSDQDPAMISAAFTYAQANAAAAEKSPYKWFPRGKRFDLDYPDVDNYDAQVDKIPMKEKIALAMDMESAAKKKDKRIAITESCTYHEVSYEIGLMNSQEFYNTQRGTYCGAHAFLVGEENGDSQTGFAMQYVTKYAKLDPVWIGQEAADKAVRMLGAKTLATQTAPVIMDPYVVTNFLGVLSQSFSAEAVQKGRSLLEGKLGERIAAPLVNIIDDGTLPEGIASSVFDGEGSPMESTLLIKDGYLKSYLYNEYAAHRDGVNSTGNAQRSSYKSSVEIGTTNLYLAPGKQSAASIFGDMDKGLYVTDVMGIHTANPISGDFSVGAAGLWIENGKIIKPVRGIAIAGNLLELIQNIDAVGDDLQFFADTGSPTIRIKAMPISGS